MFREMRRSRQALAVAECRDILDRCTNGVMACLGDEGYPYAVPLSYVHANDRIYFHTAKAGHKIDAILSNPKVSFTVIDEDRVVSREFSTYFRSVIVFGRARIVAGDEWRAAARALVEKYSGDQPEEAKAKAMDGCDKAYMVAIDIDHMAGKEAIEFVNARKQG